MLTHLKNKIVIHHTAIPHDGKEQYDRVLGSHLKRWPENGIAYHYLIEQEGDAVKGRGEWTVGYHAGVWAFNLSSLGVCLAGDFTNQKPAANQIRTLAELLVDLQVKWRIPRKNIMLHRDVKGTLCPGTDILALVDGKYELAKKRRIQQMENAMDHATPRRKKELQRAINFLRLDV